MDDVKIDVKDAEGVHFMKEGLLAIHVICQSFDVLAIKRFAEFGDDEEYDHIHGATYQAKVEVASQRFGSFANRCWSEGGEEKDCDHSGDHACDDSCSGAFADE